MFSNLIIEPGNCTFKELVSMMKEGIVVNEVIGFHSGNLLKGEFSMNVGTGYYVKNGKPAGRAMNTMIAGNIYTDFKNIKALSDKLDYNLISYTPALYIENMNVAGCGK